MHQTEAPVILGQLSSGKNTRVQGSSYSAGLFRIDVGEIPFDFCIEVITSTGRVTKSPAVSRVHNKPVERRNVVVPPPAGKGPLPHPVIRMTRGVSAAVSLALRFRAMWMKLMGLQEDEIRELCRPDVEPLPDLAEEMTNLKAALDLPRITPPYRDLLSLSAPAGGPVQEKPVS
jgi:hypothetical protein